MCIHIITLITNHAPIGEYRLKFFSKKPFACMYRDYSIEIRRHILYNCAQYRKSWNSKRESLKDVLMSYAKSTCPENTFTQYIPC